MDGLTSKRVWNMDAGWTWIDLKLPDMDDLQLLHLVQEYPEIEEWIKGIPSEEVSYLSVRFPQHQEPIIFGILPYYMEESLDEPKAELFHFFVSRDVLITLNLDEHTRFVLNTRERLDMLLSCSRPVDGMFVVCRTILHYFHSGLDRFEVKLRQVEDLMHRQNKKNIMEQIMEARLELLFWNNLFIPYLELVTGAREAYMDEISDSLYFKRFCYRADRMETLFRHYEKEIDTLIMIDNAVSGVRGNEIMKTLTILTAVFTPATVIGSIWGMNFEYLPWIKEGARGFIFIILMTLGATFAFYLLMWGKGWTGDLLHNEQKKHKKL